MQRLEVSCAVRPIYGSLGAKGLSYIVYLPGSTRWRSGLRQYITNRKVAGSIPDYVIGIFH
jgi:hypothetical protein